MAARTADAAVVYLVRHGESTWNAARRCQGQLPTAGGLTAKGRAQAAATAEQLVSRLGSEPGIQAETIVASDLLRARETAEIIATRLDLPVRVDAELREQFLGELEGRGHDETYESGTVQQAIDELWRDPFRAAPGGGESVADMYRRVQRALHRIATDHAGGQLVVVTHGGVVRSATAPQPPTPGVAVRHSEVDNASITPWSLPCPVR